VRVQPRSPVPKNARRRPSRGPAAKERKKVAWASAACSEAVENTVALERVFAAATRTRRRGRRRRIRRTSVVQA
jgi:hypothetical protein